MSDSFETHNPELDALFERYRSAPGSHVFAPLADACRKAGLLEEAIEICERGVSTHPRYASGFVVRGKCYYDIGNADQAEASFEKVLQLDANNLVALKYMGIILAERGEAESARVHFEHILALDPGDREIAVKLEELTLFEASEVLDDRPSGYEAPVSSATGGRDGDDDADLDGDEESDDAADEEEFVAGAIDLGGTEPTTDVLATMTLADIYASQGYRGKALKIYNELLGTQPDNEAVKARLRELGASRAEDGPGATVARVPDAAAADIVSETEEDVREADDDDVGLGAVPSARPESTPASEGENAPAAADETAPPRRRPTARRAEPRRREQPAGQATQAGVSQFKRWLDNLSR